MIFVKNSAILNIYNARPKLNVQHLVLNYVAIMI